MTSKEKQALSAAFWRKALADADPEHWNDILKAENLAMRRGMDNLVYADTLLPVSDNENDLHWADWAAQGAPVKGGKLQQYEIGAHVSHARICQRCGIRFESKRAKAKYCSKVCRQRKPKPEPILCLVCGTPLQPKHRDARYHPECRFRGYRAHLNIDTCADV
jgi:hypothetical protein